MLLRRQLAMVERRQTKPMRLTQGEKVLLVVVTQQLRSRPGRTIREMESVIRIVKPATLFGWHRALVR